MECLIAETRQQAKRRPAFFALAAWPLLLPKFYWRYLQGQLPSAVSIERLLPFVFVCLAIGFAWTSARLPDEEDRRKYVVSCMAQRERNPDGYRIMATTLFVMGQLLAPLPAWLYQRSTRSLYQRRWGLVLMSAGALGLCTIGIERGYWTVLGSWYRHAHVIYACIAFLGLWIGCSMLRSKTGERLGWPNMICHSLMVLGAFSWIVLEQLNNRDVRADWKVPGEISFLVSFAFWQWCMVLSVLVLIARTVRETEQRLQVRDVVASDTFMSTPMRMPRYAFARKSKQPAMR